MTQKLSESFYGQVGLSAGYIARLQGQPESIRVNNAFYLPNFKGVRNIGYHYTADAKKKGLGGDVLGFDRYATLNLKVS